MADRELDNSFAASEAWFAISLLRQSRAKAASRPGREGDLDEAVDAMAQEAHRRLLQHLYSLPEEQRRDATSVLLWAMIREDLHATKRRPAGWQRS